MPDPAELGAAAAASLVARGELTAERLARSCLDRIAAREPEVQAWQHLEPDRVIEEARLRDGADRSGPLHGVPIGIKDVIDTVDLPTSYGSAAYAGHRPAADASCVTLARAAGAVLLGKTVTTEFAGTAPGKTRNPHDLARTPGGSSSGSAAAVAAGMVPLALGTQTAGSVIRPASYCGVVGYKPSFGLIDRTGVKTLAQSLDTVGLFARHVRDAALLVSVLSGRPALARVADAAPPRVGLYTTSQWSKAEPATVEALDLAAERIRTGGGEAARQPVWGEEEALRQAQEAIAGWDITNALAFERLHRHEQLAPKTRELIEARAGVSPEAYDAAQALAASVRARLDALFGGCDVLLTPAAPGIAPAGLDSTGDAAFNLVWTMLHVPCITVPVRLKPGGLPVGVQLVGRIGDDARILSAAAFLESALRPAGADA